MHGEISLVPNTKQWHFENRIHDDVNSFSEFQTLESIRNRCKWSVCINVKKTRNANKINEVVCRTVINES